MEQNGGTFYVSPKPTVGCSANGIIIIIIIIIYVKYKGNAWLRLHGNSGYANASQCYFMVTLFTLFYMHFIAIVGDMEVHCLLQLLSDE
jgi:hypothetical protein